MSLKTSYKPKWLLAARRELALINLLNVLLPEDYVAIATGLGTGTSYYYNDDYGSPIDAFDIVIYKKTPRGLESVAFVDATGFWEERMAKKINGKAMLCVLKRKIDKAVEFGILDSAWAVHIADKRVSLRWLKLEALQAPKVERVRLVEGENIYYCLPQEKWKDTSTFISWLLER